MAATDEHFGAETSGHLTHVFIVTMITEKVPKHKVAGRLTQCNQVIFR
jgi:hypothetical protein